MKILKFLSILVLLFGISGCSSTDQLSQDSYNTIKQYHESIGGKCMTYINCDQSMTYRDKNTYLIYYMNMDSLLKTIEVKK